jgi:ubiquitin-protein ligase
MEAAADTSFIPFAIWAKFIDGRSFQVELSAAPDREGPRGALTTVGEVKVCIGKLAGMEPDEVRLIFAGKRLEDGRTLNHYGASNGSTLHVVVRLPGKLFFPLAPVPRDSSTDETSQWLDQARKVPRQRASHPYPFASAEVKMLTSPSLSAKIQRQRREIAAWAKDGPQKNELVHVWRVGKDAGWVELVIEGPPGSFYEGACRVCAWGYIEQLSENLGPPKMSIGGHCPGGAFVLRVAFPQEYPFRPFQLRMLTPLYHPTVGPDGAVAVLGYDSYALP